MNSGGSDCNLIVVDREAGILRGTVASLENALQAGIARLDADEGACSRAAALMDSVACDPPKAVKGAVNVVVDSGLDLALL